MGEGGGDGDVMKQAGVAADGCPTRRRGIKEWQEKKRMNAISLIDTTHSDFKKRREEGGTNEYCASKQKLVGKMFIKYSECGMKEAAILVNDQNSTVFEKDQITRLPRFAPKCRYAETPHRLPLQSQTSRVFFVASREAFIYYSLLLGCLKYSLSYKRTKGRRNVQAGGKPAKNNDVNAINFSIQNEIPGEATTYKSIDTVMNQDEVVNHPTEFLNSLDLPGIENWLKKMMNNIIEAKILKGKFKGENVLLPRIPMIQTDMPFEFKRLQFPVRLAFAMTINKAQGQSLQVCAQNLENPCFSHGQWYGACSRHTTYYELQGNSRFPEHFHLLSKEMKTGGRKQNDCLPCGRYAAG
ncbi:hypothetical protein PR048_017866 [Dryococelus australis]|uniref:ATP-dependent DNA helicase n=1 Tax=Dryococelus australis TaxID=614101 RepID=A0ABQ9HAR2_9NEOP|nr:hypothetical protein PR048_017866 [Dryococelus australis]